MKKVEKIEELEKTLERAKNCMHPDNFTLPMISEAAITVSSYGFNEDDKLVCTIPVPNITGKINWRTELPRDKYVRGEGDEKGEWVAEEGWELQREDEEGEHWVLPEHKVGDYMVAPNSQKANLIRNQGYKFFGPSSMTTKKKKRSEKYLCQRVS